VTSEYDKGSTFTFTAKFGLGSGKLDKSNNNDRQYNPGDITDLTKIQGAKILLVEDNKINQQIATEILTTAGFNIVVANNGQEAIDRLFKSAPETPFDLVLMDLQMPKMDGYEATQNIREKLSENVLPIIATTAHAMDGEKERCLAEGMNDYVTKPIDVKKLYDALIRWIKPGKRKKTIPVASDVKDSTTELPQQLLGIDIQSGLNRVSGNKKLYKEVLKQFVDKNRDVVEHINAAIKENDLESAKHILHTLKGVSGNIGAKNLFSISKKLEPLLKQDKKTGYDNLLNRLNKELQIIINSFDDWFIYEEKQKRLLKKRSQKENVPIDNSRLKKLIKELSISLKENNIDAIDQIESILDLLGFENSDDFLKMQNLINNLEFEEALLILNNMKSDF